MPDEIKEGLEEVSSTQLSDDLRGVVVDQVESNKNYLWIGFGVIAIILITFTSWTFLFITRSEDQVLKETLANLQMVRKMLDTAKFSIHSIDSKKEDIFQGIEIALNVTKTSLREGNHSLSPYIPERHQALIEILEGLVRLKVEKFLDESNPEDVKKYENYLSVLGLLELEYNEKGIIERVPLLRSSAIKKKLHEEKIRKNTAYTKERIAQLEQELQQVYTKESFSPVAPAIFLGKWFRYHNDQTQAKICFNIARRYVEGYKTNKKYFKGFYPSSISILWKEYSECLMALTEFSFEEKRYRQARSFLVRILQIPNAPLSSDRIYLTSEPILETQKKITALNHDISTFKKAIAYPETISHFPLFHEKDQNINWEKFLFALKQQKVSNNQSLYPLIWKQLSKEEQSALLQLDTSSLSLNPSLSKDEQLALLQLNSKNTTALSSIEKSSLIKSLNSLINNPSLPEQLFYNKELLTPKAKNLLEKKQSQILSKEDSAFLNRDILESELSPVITHSFVLSDGTRIHNALSTQQVSQLILLYEEELSNSKASKDKKELLITKMKAIYNNLYTPTFHDLYEQINVKKQHLIKKINAKQQAIQQAANQLGSIKRQLEQLENKSNVNMESLVWLKGKEETQEKLQLELRFKQQKLVDQKQETENLFNKICFELKESLVGLEQKLITTKNNKIEVPPIKQDISKSILPYIEKQISLREKYLLLLEQLKRTKNNSSLQKITSERAQLEKQIARKKEIIKGLKGDERETLQKELSNLEELQYKKVQQFEQIFNPLLLVVDEIATEERSILKAKKDFEESRKGIKELIGDNLHIGSLQEKTKKRASLLLTKELNKSGILLYEAEIKNLNKEIEKDQVTLNLLLEKEKGAQETLSIFYPQFKDQKKILDGSNGFIQLQNYLKTQQALIRQYNVLWKQNEFQEDIQKQEKNILKNLHLISENLQPNQELSEMQTQKLSRYLRGIVQARNQLNSSKRQLKSLLETTNFSEENLVSYSIGKGYLLDSTEIFQVEHQIGLHLTLYRNTFEKRNKLLNKLQKALNERELLESKKKVAVKTRNQALIDELYPTISEKDEIILSLSKKKEEINLQLLNLEKEYKKNLHLVQNFRNKIAKKTTSIKDNIQKVNLLMSANDTKLTSLSKEIFLTQEGFEHSMVSLDFKNLHQLEQQISKQQLEISRLKKLRNIKELENYYQGKALWWIGKSFYEQSQLKTFSQLLTSNEIPFSILEDEERLTSNKILESEKSLMNEILTFNPNHLYEEYNPNNNSNIFKNIAKKDNDQTLSRVWKDFLEKNALKIFQKDIPQYTYQTKSKKNNHLQQDVEATIALSRYLSGEIYLQRAIRFARSSKLLPKNNLEAIEQFDLASLAFLDYLEFTKSYTMNYDRKPITELPSGLGFQEFPFRSRIPVDLIDKAKIFLGAIASLKGNHLQSIEYYRTLLSNLYEYSIKFEKDTEQDSFSDPIQVEQYEFSTRMSPIYTSLLAFHPLSHEVLYRLGKNYLELAYQELTKKKKIERYQVFTKIPIHHNTENQTEIHQKRFEDYANKAISYYSQLILTQSYSPFRKAAYLQRAFLRKKLKDYKNARNDLVAILGKPEETGGSWEQSSITLKGDLEGELNPGYSMIAFELGKLLFEDQQFPAASEAFLKAKKGDPNNLYVLQAKIAYAQSLATTKEWIKADLFLSQLLEEKKSISADKERFYFPDLYLELALVKQNIGTLKKSLNILKEVQQYAPKDLVSNGELNLKNEYGLSLLETNFKDSIRPLALASLYSADLYLSLREFSKAKIEYKNAATLFKMLPWQEDRILRSFDRKAYENFKKENLLKAKWGKIKSDILQLSYITFSEYRKNIESIESNEDKNYTALKGHIKETITHANQQKETITTLLKSLSSFYNSEKSLLPETIEKSKVQEQRAIDRRLGNQQALYYDALSRLRETAIYLDEKSKPSIFIKKLQKLFHLESVEYQILEEFSIAFSEEINITEKDKKNMQGHLTNLDNLLLIENTDKRLLPFSEELISWLKNAMQDTGLDDLFIKNSTQAAILEEVALYQVSLLSYLEDGINYQKMLDITDEHILNFKKTPSTIQQPDLLWEQIEITALTSEFQTDWKQVEKYNRFLIEEVNLPSDEARKLKAKTSLSLALVKLAKKNFDDLPFTFEDSEKLEKETLAKQQLKEAKTILLSLVEIPGDDMTSVLTRIRAKQLLQEI